jgi:hypothetical protein
MPHTKLLRDLCHDLNNIVAGIQGNLGNIQLCDIEPGTSRDSYIAALCCTQKLGTVIHQAQDELHASYRKNYATYKGDPALTDRQGKEIRLKSYVEVPPPDRDDRWEQSYIGIVISTTRGDGIITVRDTADSCWDVDANRVEIIPNQ